MWKTNVRLRAPTVAASMLLCNSVVLAQQTAASKTPSPLAPKFAESSFEIWNGAPPGLRSVGHAEITYKVPATPHHGQSSANWTTLIRDVTRPTLTAFIPVSRPAALTAVVICPGGGMRFLTWEGEGTDIGQWFASHGVAAFVLKYRLVPTAPDPSQFDHEFARFAREFSQAIAAGKRPRSFDEILPDPATRSARRLADADARQAIKYVRSRAGEWGISADRIGMLGFSAGAFLVTDVITANDSASKLDFAALIYGGEAGSQEIPASAPPLFLAVAQDDPWMSGIVRDLFLKWDRARRPIELHYFERGGHAFATREQDLPVDQWMSLLEDWMASRHLIGTIR
jgi:dienelactone hydrolase